MSGSYQAKQNLLRKVAQFNQTKAETAALLEKRMKIEGEAEEAMQLVIAAVLDTKEASLSDIMKWTGYSNTKVKRLASLARERNRELLRKGSM